MKKTWFIGDTHFYHENILKFENEFRPFSDVQEMNQEMVERWNARVAKGDVVYHVGDTVFGGHEKHKILGELNGSKRLIMGNHDRARYNEPYFDKIYGVLEFASGVVTHIPVHESQFTRYNFNIHGHLHSKNIDDPRYVNVSCEQTDLAPIAWEELQTRIYKEVVDV